MNKPVQSAAISSSWLRVALKTFCKAGRCWHSPCQWPALRLRQNRYTSEKFCNCPRTIDKDARIAFFKADLSSSSTGISFGLTMEVILGIGLAFCKHLTRVARVLEPGRFGRMR